MSANLDRQYISRYAKPTFAVQIFRSGEPGDADSPVAVDLIRDGSSPEVVWTHQADHPGLGMYEVTLTNVDTAAPGFYSLIFHAVVNAEQQDQPFEIEVGESAPQYDALPQHWKDVVENVWIRFADLFDSPFGGPNLQVYFQSRFSRNRIAQLLVPALNRLNSAAQPFQTFAFGGDDFPFTGWGGLLAQSLYLEVIKHLRRSYVEQPDVQLATNVSRLDRRDYMDRWATIYEMEQPDFERDLSRFKTAMMSDAFGVVHVLVAGGAFGNIGPIPSPGGYGGAAARGYYPFRWAF